jgi:hypothetical protein
MPPNIRIDKHSFRVNPLTNSEEVVEFGVETAEVGRAEGVRFGPVRTAGEGDEEGTEGGEEGAVGDGEVEGAVKGAVKNGNGRRRRRRSAKGDGRMRRNEEGENRSVKGMREKRTKGRTHRY